MRTNLLFVYITVSSSIQSKNEPPTSIDRITPGGWRRSNDAMTRAARAYASIKPESVRMISNLRNGQIAALAHRRMSASARLR
jgi:hypothetical protein